jgi:hypothetical protein
MPDLTDTQLDQLITDLGLTQPSGGSQRKPIKHGKLSGYKQHRYRGEDACDDCKAGLADYQRERATARDGIERKPRVKATLKPKQYLTEEEWQARQAARQTGGAQ